MIDIICGFIYGSGATLLIYSLMVGKRIQEEQRRIRTLEYQKHELEKKLESIEREVKKWRNLQK